MGYRTEAGWLATCHPVAAAGGGAKRPGREEAGARVCGTRRGGCARAAEAPQPTGGRGGSRGSATAGRVGGQSYKEGPEVRN